jgi:hypothetical protein
MVKCAMFYRTDLRYRALPRANTSFIGSKRCRGGLKLTEGLRASLGRRRKEVNENKEAHC